MRLRMMMWLLLANGLVAQPGLEPRKAVWEALRSHPRLLRQQHLAAASRAQADQVESLLYPQMSLELVAKDGPQGVPNFRLLGLSNAGYPQSAGGGLVVTQTFDFGRTAQKLAAQQSLSQAEDREGKVQRAGLALSVLRAFGQAVLYQQLSQLAEQTVSARQEIQRQAEARFQGGLVSRVDGQLAEAETALARAERMEMESRVRLARQELSTALGRPVQEPLQAWPEALESWPHALEEDRAYAQEHRPEVLAYRSRLEAALADLEAARRAGNPSLSFYASGGYIANLNGVPASPTAYAAGLAFLLPIDAAGGLAAEQRKAEHALAAQQARGEELQREIELQVQQARLRYDLVRDRHAALGDQGRAAQEASRLARTRYKLGLCAMAELQQVEVARLRADTQLCRNRAEVWLAWMELMAVTGRLAEFGYEEELP